MASMDSRGGIGWSGAKKWLGISVRLLATILFLLLLLILNRCSVSPSPADESLDLSTATLEGGRGQIQVKVQPRGAVVLLDGLRSGTTPISLEVPSGEHNIRVEMDGYEPMVHTVNLAPGADTIIDGNLTPLTSAAVAISTSTLAPVPGRDAALPDLVPHSAWIELETGGACDYVSTQLGIRVMVVNMGDADSGPFVVEVNGSQQTVEMGLAAGQKSMLWFETYDQAGQNRIGVDVALQVEERNEDNNWLAQRLPIPTLPPTCTPPPTVSARSTAPPHPPATSSATPAPASHSAVSVYEGQHTIPTYPYDSFLSPAWSDAFNMPYATLDRPAYETSNPSPSDVTYRTLVLENEYLKLTFLPELGGRIYEVVFKPTGHNETYRNPVLKPSPWGSLEQGWWLAAGGIEWCLPVEEHGYEWGVTWAVEVDQDSRGVTVTLRDTTANDRLQAEIAVRLESRASYFTIRPRLQNPTSRAMPLKYWTNAMLAPGGQNAPSADLRFVLPDAVTAVTIHSRGDEFLPAQGQRMPWPVIDGVDLSRLGNWNRWLGFFEDPAAGEFAAVYDERYDEGMVRALGQGFETVRGLKGFGLGWRDPIPAHNWTDDSSGYVEIHSGPASTFDDSVNLPAGGQLQWTEIWYPVAGLGGLRYANQAAALNLSVSSEQVHIAVAANRPWAGNLSLLLDGQEWWRQEVALLPDQPFRHHIPLGEGAPETGQLALRLESPDGTLVAGYDASFQLR